MAPSISKVFCIYVLALSLFLCNMEARGSRFFNKGPAYENPNGGSNNAGYGEGYVTSGVDNAYGADSGNVYGSYRGQGNGNGYVYGDSEVSRLGSGNGAGYGEAGSGYRSGSGRAAEYYSQNNAGNVAGAAYKENFGNGAGYGAESSYRGAAYGSGSGSDSDWRGSNGGYGQGGDQYASGYGRRSERNGAYRSGYVGGYVTGSGNRNGYEAGSGIGNAEYVADNGYYKETP